MPDEDFSGAVLDAAATLGVLADIDRFKVISAIALGAGEIEQIVTSAGVDRRVAEKALARLVAAELITNDEGFWRVRFDELHEQARAAAAERKRLDESPTGTSDVVRRFLKRGRLKSIPAAHSKRLEVLDHLAQQFEPGRTYTEAEVNEVLTRFHDDYAALRRYMVDDKLLERQEGKYWRSGGTFNVD